MNLDTDKFREEYPQFADNIVYPDAVLEAYWTSAQCYIEAGAGGCCREQMLYLMTAHLATLASSAAGGGVSAGGAPGIVQSASIDKVSVSLVAPPTGSSQWRWWMSLSPYGLALLALLSAQAVGGFYVGGNPETLAFRKVAGRL